MVSFPSPPVAQGSFGRVYKAKFYGQDVAVKETKNRHFIEYFKKEVEVLRYVKHCIGDCLEVNVSSIAHASVSYRRNIDFFW
jgi:hypothetical protein